MQRIINNADHVVEDMLEGFIAAHEDIVSRTQNPRVLKYNQAPVLGKVGIVTGGGSGHKPAFIGYLGKNMIDAVAVGEIFSSPTAKAFLDAIREADSGHGVACLYGNYSGDNMNVKMARMLAEEEGIVVRTVVANDDVASAPKSEREKRRGVAGEILMWKTAGAKAALGGTLDEIVQVAQRTIDNTRSIGIGLTPCTIPAVGKPNFSIVPGYMELGIGHHGEPGIKVTELMTAKEMAEVCTEKILDDILIEEESEVVVLVSGLGSTPVMELYIFFNEVCQLLERYKIHIHRSYVGNYFTSLDMMGVTLTILKLDKEMAELIDFETNAVSFKQL
ncbi:MAG: dihydroxyacetone kinase [Bacteroides oleiciplenus]|nr:dihydroxyacetone kinase [Bacteroides oleiciplenus]